MNNYHIALNVIVNFFSQTRMSPTSMFEIFLILKKLPFKECALPRNTITMVYYEKSPVLHKFFKQEHVSTNENDHFTCFRQ